MEEDIKILEEFIDNYKEVQEKYKDDEIQAEIERSCYFEEIPATAIENLIARNKELEEDNIKYERANDYLQALNRKYYEDNVTLLRKNGKVDILADNIHFKYIDMVENYIPKSKVKEIIQKYYDEYEKEKEYRYTGDVEDEQQVLREIERELLEERN